MRGFPGQHTLPYSARWAQNLLCRPRDQKHPDRNFNFQINAEVLRVLRLKLSCIFSVEPHRTGHPLYQQSRNCSVTLPSIINQKSALIHRHLIQSATCAFEYLLRLNFVPKWLFMFSVITSDLFLTGIVPKIPSSMWYLKIHPDSWNLQRISI